MEESDHFQDDFVDDGGADSYEDGNEASDIGVYQLPCACGNILVARQYGGVFDNESGYLDYEEYCSSCGRRMRFEDYFFYDNKPSKPEEGVMVLDLMPSLSNACLGFAPYR